MLIRPILLNVVIKPYIQPHSCFSSE